MPLGDLSRILWQERRLVRLAADHETARFALRAAELDRAVVVQSLAETLELDAGVSLHELAGRVPSPWHDVLERHHAALSRAAGSGVPRSLRDFLR